MAVSARTWMAAVAFFAAALVPAAAADIVWSPYRYELKSGQAVEAQLGKLEVPLHHGRDGSGTLTLQFVRIPAAKPGTAPPIVYLAGGPGGSGIEAVRAERWALVEALRQVGDVILLDQRGTGLSSAPPTCPTPWSFPPDQATTEVTLNASLEAAAAKCAAEWRAKGVDISAYNTAENAADVADLARALGGKVQLVGISYGTFLAFAVLRDHSALIDRAVLAGTEGPDHTLKLPTQADDVLARLSERAAADPAASKMTPNLRRSVETVLARLDAAPQWGEVQAPGGQKMRVLISKYDVQVIASFLLATTPNAARLPALFAAMEQGNYGPMAGMVMFMRQFISRASAMTLATDAASPVSPARVQKARALVRRSVFGNAVNMPSADLARALGVPVMDSRWRTPVRTMVPGYFISGDLDSRTPPENAQEVRRGFTTSAHLVLHGAGHDNDLFLSSPVIVERIAAFLRGEAMRDETVDVNVLKFQ